MTGSEDGTAKLWAIRYRVDERDRRVGIELVEELFTLKQDRGEITAVRFSADGQHLLTASRYGGAIVWPAAAAQ